MRISSVTIITLVASLISTSSAQDCNNPLLSLYNLTGLQQPQSGQDLPYCTDLINSQTCCSASTVATFQDKVNTLVEELNNYTAAKDEYLSQLRNRYYDRFRDMLSDISDDDIRDIRRVNPRVANQLQSNISSFRRIRNQARQINNQFRRALNDYQTARTNCFTTALQIQASSWCLACNPNYATQGVADDGTVIFSDNLCQAISDACWPFFNETARFNPLIRAREAYWRLRTVSRYLDDYSDTNRVTSFNIPEDPYNPLPYQQAVTVPDVWVGGSEAANSGQCQNLWSGDEKLADLLAVGTSSSDSGTRLLQDALAGDEGVWDPDLTATGLTYDVDSDPRGFFVSRPSDTSDDSDSSDRG